MLYTATTYSQQSYLEDEDLFSILDVHKALTGLYFDITVIMTPSAVLITTEAGLMSVLNALIRNYANIPSQHK